MQRRRTLFSEPLFSAVVRAQTHESASSNSTAGDRAHGCFYLERSDNFKNENDFHVVSSGVARCAEMIRGAAQWRRRQFRALGVGQQRRQ